MPDWVQQRRRALGEHIRHQREQRGLSQVDLGERIGRDHKTVHRWEAAATEPSTTDLLLLAHALDTTIGRLFGEE